MHKQLQDKIEQLKGTFLSHMSHELRTPLSVVITLSDVLSHKLADTIPEEEYSYLKAIERNGKYLLNLINDILEISRIEAGQTEMSLSQFQFWTIIVEAVAKLAPQVEKKGITLLNHVEGNLLPVTSDLDICRHILKNLLINAIKFTPAGKIEIFAWQEAGLNYVAVRDTGIGIPEDQIASIFEPYHQVDDGTSRKYGDTGLGLAIAWKSAALLHGSLSVESTLGKGSTFTLKLPITLENGDENRDVVQMSKCQK